MSLLDRGPETVVIYPAGPVLPDGTRGAEGAPVAVRCRVQPVTSTEQPEPGYLDTTVYRVIARTLPAGPWARVTWRGRTWTVVGEPAHRRGSARTRHDTATIRRR
ncbi:hypothetical protein [Streptomyces indicus]|uniref:Head-to-tail stopper n=1 Tax=Streptomyces indicus TaxID=417292 RepID=A0A1G8W9X2_9ACTN|nr:hypothetical protein [Streptomyces indicus]SDJ74535.1 hypothetical protein SAMN05421806_102302 [Streptomyces indicus]